MSGILRGVARTAVVAGTATAVSNNVSRRQQTRWANQTQQQYAQQQYSQQQQYAQQQAYAQQVAAEQAALQQQQAAAQAAAQQAAAQQAAAQQAAAQQAAAKPSDLVAELKTLAELKSMGVLTDAEFEAAKAKLLGS